MHPFEKILAYVSVDDAALLAIDHAASLARTNRASLTIVRVLEDRGALGRWSLRNGAPSEMFDFLEQSELELLESHAVRLRADGLDVRVEVRRGIPWLELIRCVLREDYDLVVKAAEGAARGRGLFFGSTAMHLIRKCPCPVWIVGDDAIEGHRRVLAAIDPTADDTRSPTARRILDLAASMAGEKGELHAASAWRAEGETLLRNRVQPEELVEYVRASREDAFESLERMLESAGDPVESERVHFVKGDARDVLPGLVERERFDLIVMGSLGRVGLAGLLIGETAESVIRSVRCSVLVVKPPGFVSPVEAPSPEPG